MQKNDIKRTAGRLDGITKRKLRMMRRKPPQPYVARPCLTPSALVVHDQHNPCEYCSHKPFVETYNALVNTCMLLNKLRALPRTADITDAILTTIGNFDKIIRILVIEGWVGGVIKPIVRT